jgi:hypothetical protein
MARKVNKSEMIRKTFETLGADTRPRDVVAALAEKKVKVSATQVSNIKAKLGNKSSVITLDDLQRAKVFVATVGSVEKARKSINELASLLA